MDNKMKKALQLNKLLIRNLESMQLEDNECMEFADLYPKYEVNHTYKIGDIFSYGLNKDNEPQLYRVAQNHNSQEQYKPNEVLSLYTPIGFDKEGYPIWTQPYGAHDSYQKGDIVKHKGKLYISTIDNNVYEPTVYGWEEYNQFIEVK